MKSVVLAMVATTAVLFAPTALAARPTPCTKVSSSVVASTLGISVKSTRSVPSPDTPGFTVCFFGTSTNPVAASIGFQMQTGKKTYAGDLALTGHLAKVVPGLGDKAFYNTSFPGGNTSLNVLKGNVLVSFVTPAKLTKVEALAKKVMATL